MSYVARSIMHMTTDDNMPVWTEQYQGHPYQADWTRTTYAVPVPVVATPIPASTTAASDIYTLVEVTATNAVYQWYATAPPDLAGLLTRGAKQGILDMP